jgi:hypothetical protein
MSGTFGMASEQRSLSDSPPFLVKLDVWEFVRPRENDTWPFLTSKQHKATSRELAVRQAALLTYELLGGEINNDGPVKRWFKPANGLGDAGNSILYRGLEGSSIFESSGCFFQKLNSVIRSSKGGSRARALHVPASQTPQHSVTLRETNYVLRRFDLETTRLATLMVGAVVCVGFMFAALIQDRYPKALDLKKEAVKAEDGLVLKANSATLPTVTGLNRRNFIGKTTSGDLTSATHALGRIPPQENPSLKMEAESLIPTPAAAFAPDVDPQKMQVNTSSGAAAQSPSL